IMNKQQIKALFKQNQKQLSTKKSITLLKTIEKISNDAFRNDPIYESSRQALGKDAKSIKKVLRAVLETNLEGIKEYTTEFYKVYDMCSLKHNMTRDLIQLALTEDNHGFSDFDRLLTLHCTKISSLYDTYYKTWAKAVRNSDAAKKIMTMQKESNARLKTIVKAKDLNNGYTIICLDNNGNFFDTPYATYFPDEIKTIVNAFDEMTKTLNELPDLTDQQKLHIKYLKHYRNCLAEKDRDKLEPTWTKLDELWMDVKYPIQVVHDIEYGYGDPLRTKIIPDFSIRFIDDTYKKENTEIESVKKQMVKYFGKRNHKFAKLGLGTLKNSSAALYYLPFQSGMSFHHRFSGQSIPNRPEVKYSKGVKIYFDPVATKLRSKVVKNLVKKMFSDTALEKQIDPIHTIVYHISSHEFGHAIYGLGNIGDCINSTTRSLLEEPRAELTSLTMLKQMYDSKMITLEILHLSMLNFAASDLRRFVMYDSEPLKSYTISALNCYKAYEKTGYITVKDNKLHIDETKLINLLEFFQNQFEQILDATETRDSDKLDQILEEMQEQSGITKFLLSKLFKK
ncbi:MAG: hypothetical protein U9Q67_01280, partial [Patescibacteria group bacterium]|nr:hypothetical protein [Patescibacteria group bacterium]